MYTQNIKALRAVKGLRQEDLAKFLGISLNSYNNKENGKREFSLMEANSLAKLFGYSIEEIFFKNNVFKMNTKSLEYREIENEQTNEIWISYVNKKFKRGTQIVKIIVRDKCNNKEIIEWYFTVGTPIYKTFKGNFIDSENINNICSKLYRSPELFKLNDYCIINNTLDYPKKRTMSLKILLKNMPKTILFYLIR